MHIEFLVRLKKCQLFEVVSWACVPFWDPCIYCIILYVVLFQGTSGPRPPYAGNSGQGKSGPLGPPVGGNVTTQQTNLGGNSIYRGNSWTGGANPYSSLRYPTPMGPTNAAYTHQPAVSRLRYAGVRYCDQRAALWFQLPLCSRRVLQTEELHNAKAFWTSWQSPR
jgi:hypothetical protein